MSDTLAGGLVIAAPASGCGKTVITLSLLRAFKNVGVDAGSFKIGPDYIDPAYHAAASGKLCRNLDFWAMQEDTLLRQRMAGLEDVDIVITEGMMGLFDGATTGKAKNSGSTADAANWLDWPVVLVVDAKFQGASAVALVEGFTNHRDDIEIAGVIFNHIGGERHERILREALTPNGIQCLGCIPRHASLDLPNRHLGLVQAKERPELDQWLDAAAAIVMEHVDLAALKDLAAQSKVLLTLKETPSIPPLGRNTAIARDDAFAFCYDHVVESWRAAGTEISFFSPLASEAPDFVADSIYLPGGYLELHAENIAGNESFVSAMKMAAAKDAVIYGECGGFMVLGETLTGRDGKSHDMLGLLPVETSFAAPKLHLGYRQLSLSDDGPLGSTGAQFRGHEFHYCEMTVMTGGEALFNAQDAQGNSLPPLGCRSGSVMGSFAHIIDSA